MKEHEFRAPAVPLIAHDPMFSVWSFGTRLTEDTTRHWTGMRQYMIGVIAVDHVCYQFMGKRQPVNDFYNPDYPALPQISCEIRPMTTVYTFANDVIRLELRFTSPLLLNDLMLLSRPASYLSYRVTVLDGAEHDIHLYFGFSGEFCVNDGSQRVMFGNDTLSTFVSSGTEKMFERCEDNHRIEWGSFHVVAPELWQNVMGLHHFLHKIHTDHNDLKNCLNSVHLPGPRPKLYGPEWYASYDWMKLDEYYPTIVVEDDKQTSGAFEDKIVLCYDDVKALEYFGEPIDAYWKKDGDDFNRLMRRALDEYAEIMEKVRVFEDDLLARANAFSPRYADIVSLAYRQAIAGHKLTWHDGELQFVSKENFSNGCAATVDVTYPSVPLFLLYAPELVEGMLNPIFKMIEKGLWVYEFAPHDVGTYPKCNAQAYGFYLRHRRTPEKLPIDYQMPVEECGNMLLCVAAIAAAEKKEDYFLRHETLLRQWADYLLKIGVDPDNQLCTDDFAGHLAHNCNLSVKGICGVAAFGCLLQKTGREEEGARYYAAAKSLAAQWEKLALDPSGDHYKLAFDQNGTWSVKYNMIWDRLLGLGLFSEEVYQKEVAYYKTKFNAYGLPLDNRADYTKSDWQIWATALTGDREFFDLIVDRMWDFLCATPDRTPFTDWYFTTRPLQRGFQARTVQGGLYLPLLKF